MKGNLDKYLELTKPKVTLLNLLVGIVCFVLAAYPKINLTNLFTFCIAGYLAAGGCGVLNCVYDAKVDKLMPRTSARAIPAGFIAARKALLFGIGMTATGIVISYFVFNVLTALMMVLGAVFYVFVYTIILKRRSSWNVVIGGFAGCFAALSGWSATAGSLSLFPLLVSLVDFLWTPGHLWGLAVKKVKEYANAGIPMLPVTMGVRSASRITFAVNVLTIGSTFLLPLFGLTGFLYVFIALFSGAWFFFESGKLVASPTAASGFRVFFASMPYLAIIMAGLVIDKILFMA